MKLHEAIETVLRDNHRHCMTPEQIAVEIERRNLYLRKKDSEPPPDWQVRLRAKNYPDLFRIEGKGSDTRICLA